MLEATRELKLPTTITGSLPRPAWSTRFTGLAGVAYYRAQKGYGGAGKGDIIAGRISRGVE